MKQGVLMNSFDELTKTSALAWYIEPKETLHYMCPEIIYSPGKPFNINLWNIYALNSEDQIEYYEKKLKSSS